MSLERMLEQTAVNVRMKLLQNILMAGGGHTGGSLSSVDILVALYFHVMHIDPEKPDLEDRDRFIMSKGHSVESFHTVLSKRGYFSQETLDTYGKFNSILAGHPTRRVPGVELNSGALGHGPSVGTGMAIAAKRTGSKYRIFVLMGDGEQGEGSVLEAAAAAGHYHLDNLVGIVDRNYLQISGYTEEVMAIENLEGKYRACGWAIRECDGHDMKELTETLDNTPFEPGKPSLVIARTIKGKGVSFMENKASWHHRVPSAEELEKALEELDLKRMTYDGDYSL
ncbi:MAG TPA: transketolase [Bacteroides sp.]|nr:transketolase [Bacteroides sp.]